MAWCLCACAPTLCSRWSAFGLWVSHFFFPSSLTHFLLHLASVVPPGWGRFHPSSFIQGGRKRFSDIWIFTKFLIGLHEFYQSLFSRSERLTYYVFKYDDFKSVEVQGWTPLEILIFLHWTCRPTFTTLLWKRRAISHLMAVPKKRGKCK